MSSYSPAYESEVLEYFRKKAEKYDLVSEQLYWNLSDDLLWSVMDADVLSALPPDFAFLDAGGGTGRWSARILEAYPRSVGLLYDLSPDMAGKMTEKAERGGYAQRSQVTNGRLEDAERTLAGRQFDLVFNFHNVLGFVQDVPGVVRQLVALLKPGGLFVSFVPNRYHNMFFNIFVGNVDEAERPPADGMGRFTRDMPYIHMFTPSGLETLYRSAGLEPTLITGFPTLIYPGMQETQLEGSSQQLRDVLSDRSNYERILKLESSTLREPGIAARGNNLFAVGRKR